MKTLSEVARRTRSHLPGIGPSMAFALLVGLTLWVWSDASSEARRSAGQRFEFKASEASFAIEQRLLAYEQVLRGGIALFAADPATSREQWRAYVRELNLHRNFPGIQAIAYSVRIAPEDLQRHEQAVRSEGHPTYAVRPPGPRDEYFSIVYIEPFDWRNQRAFGFDLMTEPIRRQALVRARETGLPSISGKITLLQETRQDVQNGFLMCMPVFAARPGAGSEPAVGGFICSVFRMRDLMSGIFGPETLPNLRLEIFDGKPGPETMMYDSLEAGQAQPSAGAFANERSFDFDGRRWALRFTSLPAFDATVDRQKPLVVLFAGLLSSVLFSAVLWSLSVSRRRAVELARVNAGLEEEIETRTRLEEQLKGAKDAAEAANRAKSEFLANVSHELRTPLTLILAPLERLLAEPQPPGPWKVQLERMQRNAVKLLNRVNDTLDFAKAEAGKFEVHPEPVDLLELLAEMTSDAAAAAADGCTLETDLDPALRHVALDRRHFEKIALNLIGNALKFTPAGGIIRIEAEAVGEDWLEFRVRDSGPGIDEEHLPLLFQRFQQIDSSATRLRGGTGIGLALVKSLCDLMGGNVSVETAPGRGACFCVRLPRRPVGDLQPRAGDTAPATAAESLHRKVRFQQDRGDRSDAASAGLLGSPERPTALVVDDNAEMRGHIAELLSPDCSLLLASHGRQALELLDRHPVDVVISDVMMPELDGPGLVAAIKSSPRLRHLPVLLVTARGGVEASASGLDAGADDYIVKPFSNVELRSRVQAALRMAAIQKQLRERTREAGVAMVATGVLHNLGNILTGVRVTSTALRNSLRSHRTGKLGAVAKLLERHASDLPAFIERDERGRNIPQYLGNLEKHFEVERDALLREVAELIECTEHAIRVVASQQSYACDNAGIPELLSAKELMDDACRLSMAAFEMNGIRIQREYGEETALAADRHKVLQILLNLLSNARHAIKDLPCVDGVVVLRTRSHEGRVILEVADNGIGIAGEHAPRLFDQGFSTKKGGHGFGLHSSANWAREMGGELAARSDGPGLGATFTLSMPLAGAGSAEPTFPQLPLSRAA